MIPLRLFAVMLLLLSVDSFVKGCQKVDSTTVVSSDDSALISSLASESTPTVTPTVRPAHLYDLKTGPVEMFDNRCAECHGMEGSKYGSAFKTLGYGRIKDFIHGMMTERAQMNPTDSDLLAMTDYHLSIRKKIPFISVNNAKEFWGDHSVAIRGDVSFDSQVEIIKDGQTYTPELDWCFWELKDPPTPPFTVKVIRDEQEQSFVFPAQQWLKP